ncbi:MAG: hypothetical protein P4L43_14330 [Syntrophobacteraceae bacterium]|nr:hypothetical protein [Syntrophobacteraceae bacterium]
MKESLLGVGLPEERDVLRCLGYGSHSQPPHDEVFQKIRECVGEAGRIGAIRGAYIASPVKDIDEQGIDTEKGKILSVKLARIAPDAEKIVFGLVSAGEIFDIWIEAGRSLLDSCIRDAVGTVLVESGVDLLLAQIGADTGLKTSLPFSPGYCDWGLNGQELIFSYFPSDSVGIKLHRDSFSMTPGKSVSFVTCLSSEMKTGNPCRHCSLKACFMRRAT